MLKHIENLENKEKVKYDLYKILRMSILLNQKEVDKLTLDKFREASLSIDKMLAEEYDEKIESFFYETTTLEDEMKRLKDLVAFINERIEKRKNLLEDYKSVTNKELTDLDYIARSGDVDLYEIRLKTIRKYLDNSKMLEVNTKELEELKEQLVREFDIRSANEIKNTKIEETLFNTFINTLYEMDAYSSIETHNIEAELESIKRDIKEAKEQKDTFESAFDNLKLSGISGELELEYASYVENARRNYYYVKEKEIILKLYRLIENKESEYVNLFPKREEVKRLLNERIELRKTLAIKEKDQLNKIFDIVTEQGQELEQEKENIDNISLLTERIKIKENRIEELNRELKKPEILSLLKEFSLIETYDHDDVIETSEEYDDILPKKEINDYGLLEDKLNNKTALELLNELLPDEEEETNEEDLEEEPVYEDEELIFTPNIEETPIALENVVEEKVIEEKAPEKVEDEEPKEKLFEQNQIKDSSVILSMNFGLSRLKAISVMKRVGDMLGVNMKKQPEVVTQVPKEEIFITQEPKKEEPVKQQEDLFWTTKAFEEPKFEEPKQEIKIPNVIEEKNMFEDTFTGNNNQIFVNTNEPMFEFQMPEPIQEGLNNQEFKPIDLGNEMFYSEPVIPEENKIPVNNEDKFVWPEASETFDIDGIFPN